ncbi:VOC family protein [Streptomyces griseofuscus]|uniref:VOC family protein n=1 Tax=Streptomyces griseofuscus TaxID=146922 RepID=UPI001FD2D7AC|nr:VOC family protein [Streptomyces griseofuscus]
MSEPLGRPGSVALDCADPRPLAAFWAAMPGGDLTTESDAFCAVELGRLLPATARVPDYRPPQWPDGRAKQFHLDVAVEDLERAERLAFATGATAAAHQPDPTVGASCSTPPATPSASPPSSPVENTPRAHRHRPRARART